MLSHTNLVGFAYPALPVNSVTRWCSSSRAPNANSLGIFGIHQQDPNRIRECAAATFNGNRVVPVSSIPKSSGGASLVESESPSISNLGFRNSNLSHMKPSTSSSAYNFYQPTSIHPHAPTRHAPCITKPGPGPIFFVSSFKKKPEAPIRIMLDKHEVLVIRPEFDYKELKRHFKCPWFRHPTKRPFWITREEKRTLHDWEVNIVPKTYREVMEERAVMNALRNSKKKMLVKGSGEKGKGEEKFGRLKSASRKIGQKRFKVVEMIREMLCGSALAR